MSLFNNQLKNISLKEVLIVIVFLFLIHMLLNEFGIIFVDYIWIYFCIIFFFIFRLRESLGSVKGDFLEIFKFNNLKTIFLVVLLNIFLSYGFLYISEYFLNVFPGITFLFDFNLTNSILFSGLFTTIFLSPICEELIFRGVFVNRLNLIVPVSYSIVISSLIFASLHGFGSIVSAFIFGISMALLYLRTDNVFVVIFAHFINNLLAETIVFLDVNNVLFIDVVVFDLMSVLACVSFILILVWIVKQLNIIND